MIALENPKREWTKGDKTLALTLVILAYIALELVAGSHMPFSLLVGGYVAATAFAIRCNGGIKTIFGIVIFWQAFQTVLVSQIARAALGKSPEVRFDAAIPTILCQILLTLGYAMAGLVASRIRINRDRPLFPPITDLDGLRRLAIAGTILACVRIVATGVMGSASGPLHMLIAMDPLALSAAIGYSLVQSGGRRLVSPLVAPVIGAYVFFGIVGGGRGSMMLLTQVALISAWVFGYRFRLYQYVLALVGLLVMVFIISPYALAARDATRSSDIVRNMNASLDLMGQVIADPVKYQYASKHDVDTTDPIYLRPDYYELPMGNASNLLNRFGLVRTQDLIIADVLKNGTTGYANITPALDFLLPTFLSPNKGYQIFGNSNSLSHRVDGLVNPVDHTTGISMGMAADAFGAFGWPGVFLLPFFGLLACILSQKLVSRLDLTQNVFGAASVMSMVMVLTEGTVGNYVNLALYSTALLIISFFVPTRAARLFDLRYLRPRSLSEPRTAEDQGALA